MADAVDADAETLARLLTSEQGKPLADARGEVGAVSFFLRHHAATSLDRFIDPLLDRRCVCKNQLAAKKG